MKNLKRILLVLMFGSIATQGFAQTFGARASVGFVNVSSDNDDVSDLFGRQTGFQIGGTIDLPLGDMAYLESGLLYSKKGFKTPNNKINLGYINIPIGVRYHITEIGGGSNLYVAGGLYAGFLLSANADGNKLNIGNSEEDNYKPLDFGIDGGLGVLINDQIDIRIAYELGLANIAAFNDFKLNNAALLLSVGYKFGN